MHLKLCIAVTFNVDFYLTYTISISLQLMIAPGGYGQQTSNQSWTGVLGLVQRNEVDVGITALIKTVERANIADFTVPLYEAL